MYVLYLTVYGWIWLHVAVYGCMWLDIAIDGGKWLYMAIDGCIAAAAVAAAATQHDYTVKFRKTCAFRPQLA